MPIWKGKLGGFLMRSSQRGLQKSLSSFRICGKRLSYNILWTERLNTYLSVSFHGWRSSNVLRQTIFHSQPNDFSFSADWFSVLFQKKWSMAERWPEQLSVYNNLIIIYLYCVLKDEAGFFGKFQCRGMSLDGLLLPKMELRVVFVKNECRTPAVMNCEGVRHPDV